MSFSDSNQNQQTQQNQRQQPTSQRYSSNNPFISAQDHEDYSSHLPRAIPYPQPPHQDQFNDIRPISVPVNDAFDYSSYNFGESSPSIAAFPSETPLLSRDTVAQWTATSPPSPSHLHHAAGPPSSQLSQVHSPPFSSSSSSDTHLHSKTSSSLSPISLIENEQKHIKGHQPNSASKYEPQITQRRPISPNDMARQRHISFAANPDHDVIDLDSIPQIDPARFKINTEQTEEIFEAKEPISDKMAMKRHRVATQRNPKGRPKNTPKRSKSIFARHGDSHAGSAPSKPELPSDSISILDPKAQETIESHKVYFNLSLPEDMIDPETDMPIHAYPRNKVRTTKYTPLSFLPKNMYFQFSNVANIYFLFIVILGAFPIFGVSSPALAAVPVFFIVIITAIKDAIEDYRRTLLDLEINNARTQILSYWHNPNVVDDNISLWRRFKKATSRLMFRAVNSTQDSKSKKESNPNTLGNDMDNQFGSELTTSMTIRSVVTMNRGHEMEDMQSKGNRPYSIISYVENDDINPFNENAAGNVGSVLDPYRQIPGKAKFKRDYWKNVRVGDFVRIHNNEEIPADMIVVATSDSDGACYVETKNLDGETNLKVRQALKCGEGIKHSGDCERAQFWIESELAHPNLYSFNGVAKWPQYNHPQYDRSSGEEPPIGSEPISINNMLLRGCSLRNTKWVIGVVLFTGPETKIMLNAGETPSKRSKISRELNFSVICNFVLLFVICFISGLFNGIAFGMSNTSISYFEFGSIGGSASVDGIITFWAAVILYQSLVPISLYISIELVKTIQAYFIYSDIYLYYAPLDYPCTPKSWSISDDLGQVEYVFSDKTGTLTQNVMEFKKCTINGVAYGKAYTEALAGIRKREGIDVEAEAKQMEEEISHDKNIMISHLREVNDNSQMIDDEVTFISSQFVDDMEGSSGIEQQTAAKHFMLALALCHSVITEPSKIYPGRQDFKAQSPDEAALVGAARDMGFSFLDRTTSGVILNVQGVEQEYQVLNTLEFNSTRKRMSAIVKFPSQGTDCADRILLICKGADSIIYSRLKPNDQELLCQETAIHLEQFANEGLRTLCIAQKELTEEEYRKFSRDHEIASSALTNREERMEEVADALERNLTLLGGTAIEDRLQDGVPQSIALLGRAGIKLWVLTGDKVETAINIGFSCNLLDNEMELLVLRPESNTPEETDKLLTEYLEKYFGLVATEEELAHAKLDHSPPSPHHAVVIDGDTLKLCLDESLKLKFLLLCKQCKSVLCCRVSPAQKAAVVRLVKTTLGVMTLSIGDGANDVAMIQEADVGVGIAGEEGRAAVMSSDYAVGQFRFLTRLLLVHGRWSYKRLAEMIPNFFYKNIVFTFALFWYGVFSSFDGAYLFEYTFVMLFNLAFTSVPVILLGVLDQDVEDRLCLAVPQLYQRGILGLDWSQTKFWFYMSDGLYQSLVSFFMPYFTYLGTGFISANGLALDHRFWMGTSVCTIAVFSCNFFIIMNQSRWDILSVIANVVSSLLVFLWAAIYSSLIASGELYSMASELMASASFWSVILVGITLCLLPHYIFMSIQKVFRPTDLDIVREKWVNGEYDSIPPITEENSGLTAAQALEKLENEKRVIHLGNPTASEQTLTGHKMDPTLDDDGFDEVSFIGDMKPRPSSRMSLSKRLSMNGNRMSLNKWPRRSRNLEGKNLDEFEFTEDEVSLVHPRANPVRNQFVAPSYISFDTEQLYPESESDPGISPINTNTGNLASSSSTVTLQDNSRAAIRTSLDVARRLVRNEQNPPRESMASIRMSMDLEDLTTAEGLMRTMSNQQTMDEQYQNQQHQHVDHMHPRR